MKKLRDFIKEAETEKIAIGHFNVSDLVAVKGIFEAAKDLSAPIIIGTSEGEANFLGRKQIAAFTGSLREEYFSGGGEFPVFLNSDHTHSLEKVKAAVAAGYDAILFDGGKLPFEENIRATREVVEYVKSVNPEILVEGELGYIGSSSQVFKEIPEGAAVRPEDLTTPEQAERFVKETGIDLLAPAVGNIHGILLAQTNADFTRTNAENKSLRKAENPSLDIERIKNIKEAAGVPIVLHGGSGIKDSDFTGAINAGVSIIHINTEIRIAWREGLEAAFRNNPEETTPYKLLPEAVNEIKKIVRARLQLFNKLV